MKKAVLISFGLLCLVLFSYGQDVDMPLVPTDTTKSLEAQEELATEVLDNYKHLYTPEVSKIDTTGRIYYWRITERTGEIVPGNPDTLTTDYPNRMTPEGQSISAAYLGNLGLPMESRIYFERPEKTNFMFFDPYWAYTKSPEKFDFINTKIPYSNITYQTAGSRPNKEERFLGELSINFGKSLNIGVDVDYLYARGFYQSQSAKHIDWVFYGSYLTDRHRLHLFINPADYTNAENGGVSNDLLITDPAAYLNRNVSSDELLTNISNAWNRMKSSRYYLNYHYNLGFEKDTDKKDEEGNTVKQFIPVSSIIYTFDYTQKSRQFDSRDSLNLDTLYTKAPQWGNRYMNAVNDSTSYWQLRNTVGLSLREGFSSWAKFDLTAFITQDFRSYTLMDTTNLEYNKNQNSTYIGGELAQRTGRLFRYDARGSFGIIGDNAGDVDISGNIETRIPLFKDTASLKGTAYLKNLAPTFYENNFRGKYFWWNNNFKNTRKEYIGGEINIPQTKTNFKLGVENITNYIYFDSIGLPAQKTGSIQILGAILQQNMRLGALHWDNQLAYQKSGDEKIIPLPDLSIYSNLYVDFKIAKVLTIQLGANVHYFTKYYSPTYEPVTQQFHLQKEDDQYTKVGDYPLVNAYVNCHLKYTRFFIEFYNISSKFVNKPAYFSLPHYPVNPMVFKFGISWDFHN